MIRLVLAALRTRRAQTLTVLVLALVAVARAVGAPWYVLAAARSTTSADVSAAPQDQRSVSVWQETRLSDTDDPRAALADFRSAVERVVSLPGGQPVVAMSQRADASPAHGLLPIQLAYRESVCAHLRLTGGCPAAAGEVAVSRRTADATGVEVGSVLTVRPRWRR